MNRPVKLAISLLLVLVSLWLFINSESGQQAIHPAPLTEVKPKLKQEHQKPSLGQLKPEQSGEITLPLFNPISTPSSERLCSQRLQFILSSEQSIKQAANFQRQFLQDSRLKILPICIVQPLWVDAEELNCDENWLSTGRLGCELQSLGERLKSRNFTHLVIFAEQGKANVHNGVMYLDRQDSYDVFVHELAHFAGFIDEYPLSKALASGVCEGKSAPNLVFKQVGQGHADLSLWSSFDKSHGVSVATARTCDKHSAQAYKPTDDITFMEFYDQAYIPPIYIAAWIKRLANPEKLTPAYINFAQLYEEQNKSQQGTYWRKRYVDYRQGE